MVLRFGSEPLIALVQDLKRAIYHFIRVLISAGANGLCNAVLLLWFDLNDHARVSLPLLSQYFESFLWST